MLDIIDGPPSRLRGTILVQGLGHLQAYRQFRGTSTERQLGKSSGCSVALHRPACAATHSRQADFPEVKRPDLNDSARALRRPEIHNL